jgi:hypothetical protein
VDGQDGTAHPGQGGLGVLLAGRRERRVHEEQVRRGRGFQGPADTVLALLGRVRLGKHLAEEELEVPWPVAQHVVPVDLGPALLGGENLVEVITGPFGGRRGKERSPGPDRGHAETPFRVPGGGHQGGPAAGADPGQDRSVGADGVHDRDGVGHELGICVRSTRTRPVRAAIAPRVDCDHLKLAGQVRHLGLPGPRVNQGVDRHEHERRRTRTEDLVGDLDTVPLEALGVRISRPHVPSSPVFPCLTSPVAAGLQRRCNPPAQSCP